MKALADLGVRSQKGFTLAEISVVLAIMGLLAAYTVPNLMDGINERRANVTIQDSQTILDSARAYRIANGSWPDQSGNCANAMGVLKTGAFLSAGFTAQNKYNAAFKTSCTNYTFSLKQTTAKDWDGVVANGLTGSNVSNSTTYEVTSVIGVPGSEIALDGRLSRVDTGNPVDNRMETAINMNNNDITSAKNITTSTLAASGNVSAGGSVSASGNITAGQTVSAQNATIAGTTSTSNLSASNSVTTKDLTAWGSVSVGGNVNVSGTTSTTKLQITGAATAGGSCSGKAIALDSSGGILSCQSGVWSNSRTSCGGNGGNGWCDTGNIRTVWGVVNCPYGGVVEFYLANQFSTSSYTLVTSSIYHAGWYSPDYSHAMPFSYYSFKAYCAGTLYGFSYIAVGPI